MNTSNGLARRVVAVGLLLMTTMAAHAADGFDVKLSINGVPPAGVQETWRYLQVIQVHMAEVDRTQLLSTIGCITNLNVDPDVVSCDDLARADQTSDKLKRVRSITYQVFKSDWPGFRQMANEVNNRFEEEETGNVKLARSKTPVVIPEPACNPPAGCYSRPICTMYAGCSKSTYSCTPCAK